MKINKINVKTKTKKYSIIIGRKLIGRINKFLKDNQLSFEKCLVITDKNVPNKFKNLLYKKLDSKKLIKIEITDSEKNKNHKSI